MKVDKLIKSKIKRDYFFVTGKVPIDTKYFIEEIEKGIKQKENLSFRTNLVSEMTHYEYFMKNEHLLKIILNFMDLIDEQKLSNYKPYELTDAWGFNNSLVITQENLIICQQRYLEP